MNRARSIVALLAAVSAAALAAAPAAEAASSSRGGGNYSAPMSHTYQPNNNQPYLYQRSIRPRGPVFGPGAPARMPPANTAPNLSAPARSPRVTMPNRGTSATSGLVRDFRGRDFSRFSTDDKALWTHGAWHHGRYHGLYGWWWFAAGFWYWYEEPIYPYPDYVSEEVEPETGEEQPSEATPPEGLTGDVYYYCTDPEGYYPDVPTCNAPWETVPAAPSQ